MPTNYTPYFILYMYICFFYMNLHEVKELPNSNTYDVRDLNLGLF